MTKNHQRHPMTYRLIPLSMLFLIIGVLFFKESPIIRYVFLISGLILGVLGLFRSFRS